MKMAEAEKINFESSLAKLEEIVKLLEKGDVTLDKALELFETGIKLANTCLKKLDEAEQRVAILIKSKDGEIVEENFKPEEA